MPLGPAGVHAVEHLAPVLGLGAACAGLEGYQGVVAVVFAGQEGFETRFLHLLFQFRVPGGQLIQHGVVVLFDGHFADGHEIVPGGQHLLIPLHLGLQLTAPLHDLLGDLLVVPEAVGLDLGVEPLQLFLAGAQVQRIRKPLQLGPEPGQLHLIFVKFNHTHNSNHALSKIALPLYRKKRSL